MKRRNTKQNGVIKMKNNEPLYIACIMDRNGKILKAVSSEVIRDQAENILKNNHYQKWVRCEAIPQLSTNPNIHN